MKEESMSFSWKTARNIMRKDQGISSDVQRLEELISLVFLRIYDALEEEWEDEAENDGREFNSAFTDEKYKWRNWALPDKNGKTLTGDELLILVDNLFKYCKKVNVEGLEPRQRIIRKVFADLNQYMKDGTNLRELVDLVNELNYHDAKQRNLFGQIYEEMLKLLQSAGSAGEFYTPRAVTKFIVEMLNPRVGETFGDFACGTGGFLTAAIDYFHEQKNVSNEDVKKINNSIFGFEYKPFPYLLCNTNLLVHGIDTPQIEYGTAFCKPINDFDEKEKVDVIAMNPPYGGVTTAAELTNIPAQFKTSETAVLFIAYITKRLKQNGRAGVIIPDGFLFGNDGASIAVKMVLLEEMNLHTIIRLPASVFAPYTSIATNILFFDNKKSTEDLWVYRMDMPEDLKHFSKTKPITDEHMAIVKIWWNNRIEMFGEGNEKARCFKKSEIAANGYNLDLCKYPKDEEEILSPKELINHFETVNSKCLSEIEDIFNSLKSSVFDNKPINTQNLHTSCFTELSNLTKNFQQNLKKSILQEAITGQLTETWRKTANIKENGNRLLDRIIEERNAKALAEWEEALKKNPKAKKPAAIVAGEIDEEDIPFEVPESWCFCHLGEICNEIRRGKSPKYIDRSDYLAFAQKCNVKTGGIDLSLALYLDEKTIGRYSEEDNLIQGDIVINSTGGGTMGRVGYYETKVPEGIKGVYPDSHVTVIRSIGNINQRYLYYVLKHNQPILEDCGTGSTNQTELKPGVLANFIIPLPPLEEQEEIVKKVEELIPLCK